MRIFREGKGRKEKESRSRQVRMQVGRERAFRSSDISNWHLQGASFAYYYYSSSTTRLLSVFPDAALLLLPST